MSKWIFPFIILFPLLVSGKTKPSREMIPPDYKIKAIRLENPINLDGRLDEHVWQNGDGVSDFTQREPEEETEPSQKTLVHLAYDDEALYIGARMYDTHPDSIVGRLARRDVYVNSDRFVLCLDPYLDRRTGYYFGLNAGGTQYDGVLFNDEWSDDSWDGVWEGRVERDQYGWTAEMRIPFSQLRFKQKSNQVWGVNFLREIQRNNEKNFLAYTPKNSSGFVSRFPQLVGMQNLKLPSHFEILPYARTKAEYTHPDEGNPFNDGSRYAPDMGVDIKYGLGSNLTLNMTVNPDFGQVEVDPAVVNLGDVETFYSEKRPFFIEGSSIFNFGYGGSNSFWGFNWWGPTFFHSRRIGRAPQGSWPDNDYADVPEGANILSAAKITGKLGDNWNVGAINALTKKEAGRFEYEGKTSTADVEPLTYYGVFRAQRDLNDSRQGIGFMSTITARHFDDARLRNDMNSKSLTLGMDGWTFLDTSKTWVIAGWAGATHVMGTTERITNLQRNSQHYFQKPDADHVHVDSTATSLTGYAVRLWLNKQKGNWLFNSAFGMLSPSFDVNDLGFMGYADWINSHVGFGYKWTEPGSWYRSVTWISSFFASFDFGGNRTAGGLWNMFNSQLSNYWYVECVAGYYPGHVDNRLTRGGPLSRANGGYELNAYVHTDDRKSWDLYFGTYGYRSGKENWNRQIETGIEWKPKANVSVSFGPEIFWNHEYAQWVDVFEDPTADQTYGSRYVFGEMAQIQTGANIRLNWTFTPKLSLQLYLQPLISHGDYSNFKELAEPGTYDFHTYTEEISLENDEYTVDPDGAGEAEPFTFSNPDFHIKSLRGNAVLRWEYLPGSTLYFVWTQQRFNSDYDSEFGLGRSLKRLWSEKADNIFMVKMTYWLNI